MRVFRPQVSKLGLNYIVPDKNLRYRHMPNCKLLMINEEINGDFYTNSQGFRNKKNYKPDSKVILILGDSFTFGFGIKQQKVFSSILQKRFDKNKALVNIINAGAVGYGTDQEYLFLKDFGLKMQPDLVVINMYINDPLDNVWRSIFYLDQFGAIKRNPSLNYSLICRLRWFLSHSHLYIFFSDLLEHVITKKNKWDNINSYIGVLLSNDVKNYAFKWPFFENLKGMNLDNWKPLNSNDFYNQNFEGETWDYAMRLQKILLKKIIDLLSAKKTPYLFTLIPHKKQILGQKNNFDRFQNHLIKFFKKNGAPYIDLRSFFSSRSDLYFRKDIHWNEKGHDLFSRVLYKHL